MKKEKLNKINVGIDDSTLYAESVTSKSSNSFMCVRPQKRDTQKGITLVALVITIIVMLLLSVVSINLIQNLGLIEKVKLAKEEHRASTIQEQKELFEKEIEISKYEGNTPKTINDLLNKLEEEKLITEEEKNTIMQTGRITIGSKKIIFDKIILPEGYTRCAYLESTGTQFLNLGSLPVKNDFPYINCTFQYVKRQTHQKDTILSQENYVANSWMISQQYQQKRLYWWANSWGKSLYVDREDYLQSVQTFINENKDVTLMINNDILSFKNITSTPYNYTPIFLLYGHGSTNTIARIFKLHIGNSKEDIVMNLIPVIRKSDNEVCMYDTVSGQFFENQGTGEFIAGPVVE